MRSSHLPSRAILFCIALLLITLGKAQAITADDAGLRASVDAANKSFVEAFKRHDARAMAMLFLPDGINAGKQAVQGRGAIERVLARQIASVHIIEGACTTQKLKRTGDLAWEIGGCTYRLTGPHGPIVSKHTFLTIWRYVWGAWKIAVNMPGP